MPATPDPTRAMAQGPVPRHVFGGALAVVLAGSAVYFAGSMAAPALGEVAGWSPRQVSAMTWAVQLGFVIGTMVVAGFDLSDRIAPGRLSAGLLVAAAVVGAGLILVPSWPVALALRFAAGALAGPVYPIMMRFLASWYARLGARLGVLLAAYALGVGVTSMLLAIDFPWRWAILGSSSVALVGAVVAAVGLRDGPRLLSRQRLDIKAALHAWSVPVYRWSALAYFGHMWELFAFWVLLPFWLAAAGVAPTLSSLVMVGVFVAGALGCLWAAARSQQVGAARPARLAIVCSGILALTSPLWVNAPLWLVVPVVWLWGGLAVADSPMFSAMSGEAAPRAYVGSALATQNGIGFLVPVVPLLLIPEFVPLVGWHGAFVLLALGPLFGAFYAWRLVRAGVGVSLAARDEAFGAS